MSQGQGGWGGPPGGFGGPPGGGGGNGNGNGGWQPFGPPAGGGGAPPFGAPPGGGAPPFGAPPGGGAPPFGAPPGGGFVPQYNPYAAQFAPGFVPHPPKRPRTGLFAGLGIGLITVACVVCGAFAYLSDRQDQQTFGALTAACEGRAVPGTRAYTPGPGTHRVVGAERGSSGGWRISNYKIPGDQRATGLADAEAVLCLGQETDATVGSCEIYSTNHGIRIPGSDRTYDRVQQTTAATLVNASTGQTILQGSIIGPTPRQCGGSYGAHPTAGDFRGGSAGQSQVGPWLTAVLAAGGMGMIPIGN